MSSAKVFSSGFAPLTVDDKTTISQFMTRYNPDNVSPTKIVHADTISGKSITYGALRTEAAKCAWGLQQKLALKEGDALLVLAPNCTDFVLLAHATWWTGAVFSPLNPSSTTNDIVHVLDLVQPSHIALTAEHLNRVQDAIGFSVVGKENKTPKIFTLLDRVSDMIKFPEDVVGETTDETLQPHDLKGLSSKQLVAIICFSSGTTGKMKGVKLSHYNVIMNILQGRASLPRLLNSEQSEVFFPPYCHIYGMWVVLMNGMWVGNFTCALPAFDLELFCKKMEEHKATLAHLVPPVALLLASSEIPTKYDMSALRTIVVAAAPLKKSLQQKLKTRFPKAKVLQGYGLSECSPGVMHQHENDEEYVGTCGKVLAGTEVRLVDPNTGKDVKGGEEGELWVRGPQVMMGYVKDEEATRNTFAGEWLRTGDVMTVDENNNFYVTDRLKEMIKYKGFQVAPSELEDMLLQHPDVIDAAVCSIYDSEQATELPLAYVSLAEKHANLPEHEKKPLLENIRSWVDSRVAGYKRLRGGVLHLQSLPKTPSGKLLRKELPAKLKERRENRM